MGNIKQILNLVNFSMGSEKPVSGPSKVCWELTYQCNSNCKGCSRRKNDPEKTILSTEEGKNLISELAAMDTLSINFSGGEPLLRKDFKEIYRRLMNESFRERYSSLLYSAIHPMEALKVPRLWKIVAAGTGASQHYGFPQCRPL